MRLEPQTPEIPYRSGLLLALSRSEAQSRFSSKLQARCSLSSSDSSLALRARSASTSTSSLSSAPSIDSPSGFDRVHLLDRIESRTPPYGGVVPRVELAPHRFPLSLPHSLTHRFLSHRFLAHSLTHSLTPSLLPFLPRLTLGIIYPTFKSFEAIESKTTQADDEQWLTYWVVYVTLNILETLMWPVLMWVPLYSVLKCGVISWLVMPRFCGARLLYTVFLRKGLYMAAETLKEVPAFEDVVKAFVDKSDGKGKVATQSHSVAGGAEHAD